MPRGPTRTPREPLRPLTAAERAELERARRARNVPRALYLRARIILAAADGNDDTEVAALAGCDPRTARKWIDGLNAQGLPGLRDAPRPGSSKHIAAFCPHTGEVPGSVVELRARGEEFAAFMESTLRSLDARYPQKRFALVMDNLNVHKTAAVRATLRPYGGRVRVYFTPTSASWLNLIESWFSALSRAALRNSHPTGHEDVCALIGSYVQAWCADPHPYHWPRQQRPARRRHAYSAWSYRMRH